MKRPSKKASAAAAIALAITIPAEGLRRFAYYDPPGIPTVCYGATRGLDGARIEFGREYSLAECQNLLTRDMEEAVAHVERLAPAAPVNVTAAFADAVYNLGPVIVTPSRSTAARLLKAGRWREACDQLPRWDKARVAGVSVALPGLTKRRKAERELCLEGLP